MDYCLCPHKSHLHTVPHVCILSKQDSLIVRCYVIDYVLFLHKSHLHTGVILQRIHTRRLYTVHTESCPYSDYCLCPHKSLCTPELSCRECTFVIFTQCTRHLYTQCTLSHVHTVTIVSVTVTRASQSSPHSAWCVHFLRHKTH